MHLPSRRWPVSKHSVLECWPRKPGIKKREGKRGGREGRAGLPLLENIHDIIEGSPTREPEVRGPVQGHMYQGCVTRPMPSPKKGPFGIPDASAPLKGRHISRRLHRISGPLGFVEVVQICETGHSAEVRQLPVVQIQPAHTCRRRSDGWMTADQTPHMGGGGQTCRS